MKPFLCTDVTNDKKNERLNGAELAVATTPQATVDALNNTGEEILDAQKKAQLPWYLRTLRLILLVIGLGVLRGFIEVAFDNKVGFVDLLLSEPWLALLPIACFVGAWLLSRYGNKRAQKMLESDEVNMTSKNMDELVASIYRDFGVPEGAPEVEILSFSYKMKDGEMKVTSRGTAMTPYINYNHRMFINDNNLVVADRESKYEIPLSMIRALKLEKTRVSVPMWYKDEEVNSEKYKEYKLNENEGLVSMKYRLKLEFYSNGEEWVMFLPYYEKATVEMLTRMTAVEE